MVDWMIQKNGLVTGRQSSENHQVELRKEKRILKNECKRPLGQPEALLAYGFQKEKRE